MEQNNIGTRRALMRRIQMYQLAVTEAVLFLDTNPENTQALEYHNKYDGLLKEAKEEYVKRFGSLDHSAQENQTRWTWVDDPWPWDIAANSEAQPREE